jgi:transcription elongation factor GreA
MAVRERNRTVARRRAADTESEVPVLTAEGRRMIESRVRRLQHDVLPVLVGALRESEGEGREELEYTQAEGELRRLTRILATSREIGEPDRSQGVRRLQLGDEVELRSPEGGAERLLIVHPAEAPLDDRRISVESPLGVAVLGRIPGEEVVVEAPGEPYRCRLVRWSRAEAGWRLIAEIVPG